MANNPNPYQAEMQIDTRKGPSGGGQKPDNYLIHSIFATVCCCVPLGIVSIVFASQVDSKWNQGDIAGAHKAAASAKTWFWISLIAGLVGGVVSAAIQIAIAANQ